MESRLAIKYKGGRDYAHGTDIYNQAVACLMTHFRDLGQIDIAFHKLARSQLKLLWDEPGQEVEPVSVLSFLSGGKRTRAVVIETGGRIEDRYPYPEDEIVAAMEVDLDERIGRLAGACAYSDIEVWVAMTKALHQRVFAAASGKWLFVRGRFPRYTANSLPESHSIRIVASFNDKLTRSEVLMDNEIVGEIYFSRV